ncbi:MAG: leucine-rich repeat protein [Fibrobacteres bacterium]|nr:leucine-rich repeat protein [Fibrobacterota bacterium]
MKLKYLALLAFYLLTDCSNPVSKEKEAIPPAPPETPNQFSGHTGIKENTLTWSNSTDSLSYNLYWSTEDSVSIETAKKVSGVTSPFKHTALDFRSTYAYVLTAVNQIGESQPTTIVRLKPLIPPPVNPKTTPGKSQITLTWNPVAGASGYRVYWSNIPGVTPTTGSRISSTTSALVHTSLDYRLTYYYIITTLDSTRESAPSTEIIGQTVLPQPQGFTATPGVGQITLQCDTLPGATQYNIYWSNTQGVTPITGKKMTSSLPNIIHSSLNYLLTYYYIITAADSGRESEPLPEISLHPDLPAPRLGGSISEPGKITLRWDSIPGATAYNIYWSTSKGVTQATGNKLTSKIPTLTHTGLDYRATYYYIVTFSTDNRESPPSSETVARTALPTPTGVKASSGLGTITLQCDSLPGITQYNIYWSNSPGVTKANGKVISSTEPKITLSKLNYTLTYYYIITTLEGGRESVPCAEINARPEMPSPTGGKALPGTGTNTLQWDAVSGVTHYNIYWSTTPGVTKQTGTKLTCTGTQFIHTGLNYQLTYYYIITAADINRESAPSNEFHSTPTISSPENIRLSAVDNRAILTWKNVPGAEQYDIYRTAANSTPFIRIQNVNSPCTLTSLDTGLYSFQVRALRSFDASVPDTTLSCRINGFIFELEGDHYVVKGHNGTDTILSIPNKYAGKPVTTIGEQAFSNKMQYKRLYIPEGITTIRMMAFYSCSLLTGPLILPSTVSAIGPLAFTDCNHLDSSLVLPASLTEIPQSAFLRCTRLKGPLVLPPSLVTIGSGAFANDSLLQGNIQFPSTLRSIGANAFGNCKSLTGSLLFPDSLKSIGGWAFYECSGLTGSLVLPHGLSVINQYTFTGCRNMTGGFAVPEGVTFIDISAFVQMNQITGPIIFPASLKQMGACVIYNEKSLQSVIFRNPVPIADITSCLFSSCPSMKTIKVPASALDAYKTAPIWKNWAHLMIAE